MTILSKDDAKAILSKALSFSKADGFEANLQGETTGNLRYARNTVTTSGIVEDLTLVVQSNYGKRMSTATMAHPAHHARRDGASHATTPRASRLPAMRRERRPGRRMR